MSKNKPNRLTDVLRAAIEQSGLTRYRIGKATGMTKATLGASFGANVHSARQGRRAGRLPGASAGAGPRRRTAGTDAGKLGTADTGEAKGETKGELTGSDAGESERRNHGNRLQENRNQAAAGRGEDHRPQGATACRVERRQGQDAGRHPSPSARTDRPDCRLPPGPTPPSIGTARGSCGKWPPAAGTNPPPGRYLTDLERRAEKVKGEDSDRRRRRDDRPPGNAAGRTLRRLP